MIVRPLSCPALIVKAIMPLMTKFIRSIYEKSSSKNFEANIILPCRKFADNFLLNHVVPQINMQQWPHTPPQNLSAKPIWTQPYLICPIILQHLYNQWYRKYNRRCIPWWKQSCNLLRHLYKSFNKRNLPKPVYPLFNRLWQIQLRNLNLVIFSKIRIALLWKLKQLWTLDSPREVPCILPLALLLDSQFSIRHSSSRRGVSSFLSPFSIVFLFPWPSLGFFCSGIFIAFVLMVTGFSPPLP